MPVYPIQELLLQPVIRIQIVKGCFCRGCGKLHHILMEIPVFSEIILDNRPEEWRQDLTQLCHQRLLSLLPFLLLFLLLLPGAAFLCLFVIQSLSFAYDLISPGAGRRISCRKLRGLHRLPVCTGNDLIELRERFHWGSQISGSSKATGAVADQGIHTFLQLNCLVHPNKLRSMQLCQPLHPAASQNHPLIQPVDRMRRPSLLLLILIQGAIPHAERNHRKRVQNHIFPLRHTLFLKKHTQGRRSVEQPVLMLQSRRVLLWNHLSKGKFRSILRRDKYAAEHPRRTEIRSFDTIEATKVIEANEKLYINRADGFIGTSLKKDEFVENCSPIDDVIIFYRDGTYKITRVQEKVFVGETERSKKEKKKAEIIHIAIFKKNDKRTIYNVVYRDGKAGAFFIKRFNVTAITHDREYDLTTGEPGSRIHYFTANPNGEAEIIKVTLKPNPRLRRIFFEKDFGEILVKGRQSRGNLLTKLDVHKIVLKAHGGSTLGGRKVWFDHDVARLNYDERGQYLGEFHSGDSILVILRNGDFYTTNFDLNNHYEPDLLRIEKFDENKVWTLALFDADQQGFPYLKRFTLERTSGTRRLNFMSENPKSEFILLTDAIYPRLLVTYGGSDAFREPLELDAESFIGVKSYKAKGKRITTCAIDKIEELEPLRFPEPQEDGEDGNSAEEDSDESGDGQLRLF